MNPLFQKLYKHKKTRVRDPNLPPPPNLFSTVRDLKDTKTVVDSNSVDIQLLKQRVDRLEARNRYLENYVEILRGHLSKK
mgnify:CR=1 FL=1